MIHAFVGVSILLQLIAAGLAVRFSRTTHLRASWALIAAAIFLMAMRRSITLFWLATGSLTKTPDLTAELIALCISALMATGIALAIPQFKALKKAQDALAQSEGQLRSIIAAAPDLMTILDHTGTFLRVLGGGTRQQSFIGQGAVGKTIYEVLPTELAISMRRVIQQALASGDVESIECKANMAGKERTFSSRVVRMDADGEPCVLCVSRDVTPRAEAQAALERQEDQLIQAQKMEAVGQLATGIANDLGNLISIIHGYADIAARSLPVGDPTREQLKPVCDAARQAIGVVSALVGFTADGELDKGPVLLQDAVSGPLDLFRLSIPSSIELSINLAPDRLAYVLGDATQLGQAVLNLAMNAQDAVLGGGRISIDLTFQSPGDDQGLMACIAIHDTGFGMSAAAQAKIFDPLFSTKPKCEASGMGLPIVRSIIKAHGGRIEIDSEPGDGTTARIWLPLIDEPALETIIAPQAVFQQVASHGSVLVGEPNQLLGKLIASELVTMGYSVVTRDNGPSIIERASRDPDRFALLVLSDRLLKVNGLDCVKVLRDRNIQTPVVLVTGAAEPQIKNTTDLNLVVIRKPITLDSLAGAIDRLINPRPPAKAA